MNNLTEMKSRALAVLAEEVPGSVGLDIVSVGDHPAVQALLSGEKTREELIQEMIGEEPYELLETSENNFMIRACNRHAALRKIHRSALEETFRQPEKLLRVAPELRSAVEAARKEVETAACSKCRRMRLARDIMKQLMALDLSGRNLQPLEELYGADFVQTLSAEPVSGSMSAVKLEGLQPPDFIRKQLSERVKRDFPELLARAAAEDARAFNLPEGFKDSRPVTGDNRPAPERAPRPGCYDCVRKHLAQAVVLLGESCMGYPEHRWLAVGHLAEASEEILEFSQQFAADIRAERLALMADKNYMPQLMDFYPRLDELERS